MRVSTDTERQTHTHRRAEFPTGGVHGGREGADRRQKREIVFDMTSVRGGSFCMTTTTTTA